MGSTTPRSAASAPAPCCLVTFCVVTALVVVGALRAARVCASADDAPASDTPLATSAESAPTGRGVKFVENLFRVQRRLTSKPPSSEPGDTPRVPRCVCVALPAGVVQP